MFSSYNRLLGFNSIEVILFNSFEIFLKNSVEIIPKNSLEKRTVLKNIVNILKNVPFSQKNSTHVWDY